MTSSLTGNAEAGARAGVRVIAPAKLNLVLEVLGKRRDGYHDIDTVMTTIDLADELRLRPHPTLEVSYDGPHARDLAVSAGGTDLVTGAALALAAAAGIEPRAGIEVTKRIPHPAGLGGGSSDAAAALRGLNALWGLHWPAARLAEVAVTIGSDAPFFVYGGNAHCTGRGDTVEALRDLPELRVLVLVPPVGSQENKTARRYADLTRSDFSDGGRSQRLAYRVARGAPPPARDLYNTFEAVIERTDFELMGHFAAYRAVGAPTLHLCGSGPAAFLFVSERAKVSELRHHFREAGAEVIEARTLRRAAALRLEPLDSPPAAEG
ncbi:MAG: 4-(cytidine 5'-diphospho)-2-C-methyl-D-erythritol kinase [Dehalococcoidia bacterium]|nr:4-(cytidine 5'-diphospho)-2-C-methyl-D-erythritol kinase [Dehalococcoidia bacterium]